MKRMIVATLFSAIAGMSLHAQSTTMKANIPFEFHIGKTVLPAGHYAIEDKTSFLVVRQVGEGNKAVLVLSQTADPIGSPNDNPRLTFYRYGSTYFLRQVWGGPSGVGRQLPQTSDEKSAQKEQLAKVRAESSEIVALLASRD
jgi:hypothetical protein